jgi:hypothetical protein
MIVQLIRERALRHFLRLTVSLFNVNAVEWQIKKPRVEVAGTRDNNSWSSPMIR